MTDHEIKLIHSPLTRTHSADVHTLQIQIYRSPDSPWILEIVDEQGTSTVWDDPFDTDTAALEAAFVAIETEGVDLAGRVGQLGLAEVGEVEPADRLPARHGLGRLQRDQWPRLRARPSAVDQGRA